MSVLAYPLAAPGSGVSAPIAHAVEWLRLPLPFSPHHINVYRIATGDGTMLVDTGYADEETTRAWQSLGSGPPAQRVVVTHFHPDHIGQAARLETEGATIFAPTPELAQAQALLALSGEEMQAIFTAFFAANGVAVPATGLGGGNRYRRAVPALPEHAIALTAGALDFAPEWRVRFAGGHSPAHALLFRAEPATLVAGDILLPEITPNISVWPDAPEADPLGDYLAALEGLRELPADTLVLPAHGLPYRGLYERIEALAAHHEGRLNLLRAAARGNAPLAAADAIPRLFGADVKPASLPFALGEALAHLNRLWHLGEFERSRDASGVFRYAG